MPNKQKAQYEAWRIWFEKLFPYLNDQKTIVIGYSLGGLFVSKYLSENTFPKRISQLHLVAPVFDNHSLHGESVGDFILDPAKLGNTEAQCDEVFIYQSSDDTVCVPYHGRTYAAHLPKAHYHEFANRGHFNQPAFPELLAHIVGAVEN